MTNINNFTMKNTGFYTPKLKVQQFSIVAQNKCYIMDKEQQTNYTLIYINKGNFNILYNGKSTDLNRGDIFLSKPYEKFFLGAVDTNKEIVFIQINIHPTLFSELDKSERILRPFDEKISSKNNIYKNEAFKDITIYFTKITEFFSKNMPLEFYKSLVTLILFEICTSFDKKHNFLPAKFSNEYDIRIYSYIQSKSLTDLKVEDVSNEFFVSKWYIDKVCKKFYNGSFSFMLKNEKMIAARNYISEGIINDLNKIAELCGYNDYSGFFKAYKKFYHFSPKEDMDYYKKYKHFERN